MLKNKIKILLLLNIIICGCSENNDKKIDESQKSIIQESCTELSEDLLSCDFKMAICSGVDKVFIDKVGDVNKPFVDLTEMVVTFADDCVGVTWKLEKLPETFIVNHSELDVNANNYSWSAYFDIDENKLPSKGDLFISVVKDKFEGESEEIISISKLAHGSLAEVESLESNGRLDVWTKAFISKSVSANSFSLYLPKALHPSLSKITNKTPIDFTAQFNDGKNQYRDRFPDD